MRDLLGQRLSDVPRTASLKALTGDYAMNPDEHESNSNKGPLRPAAVLVPIVEHLHGETVLLTRRTDHLNNHAGQISFPGGGVEEADAGPVETALRETHEEIGLPASRVEIIGALDVYETGTGFSVTPVVGIVEPGFTLSLDEFEVAEAFEVPLSFLLDPANHKLEKGVWKGIERYYWTMPYKGYEIWGATAGMLVNLYQKLRD